ncbi:hypothetical protein EB796_001554 [Bugula neritina]|uniref:Uncharacterized protein n=1 Tax=Bugula neritina TaxID=10212 RepID=A0A7J7KPZ2_BUGNE|nr:hypothetical protein EB796_001554 [Bugula neritina]
MAITDHSKVWFYLVNQNFLSAIQQNTHTDNKVCNGVRKSPTEDINGYYCAIESTRLLFLTLSSSPTKARGLSYFYIFSLWHAYSLP